MMSKRSPNKLLPVVIAVNTVLGVSATLTSRAVSAIVPDGSYDMVIVPTPTFTISGTTFYDTGSDGNWNSSFSLGQLPGPISQRMADNTGAVAGFGSSIQDGYAGTIGVTVSASNIIVNNFSIDAIIATAGGTFVQYVDTQSPGLTTTNGTSLMSGTISGTTMSFDPGGRYGSATAPQHTDVPWNIDNVDLTTCSSATGCMSNGTTTWSQFTTGSATNSAGTINGTALVNVGDLNGDGLDDFTAVLVSGGLIGEPAAVFIASTPYFEVWRINLLSKRPGDCNADGVVDIGDLVCLRKIILGDPTP